MKGETEMKNKEEIVDRIEDAWVLQELLYDKLEVFGEDEVFDKTLEVIGAFADIIYEIVGIGEEEQEEIQNQAFEKYKKIRYIIEKTE